MVPPQLMRVPALFLLTPLREGRPMEARRAEKEGVFLLTPLREGRLREEEKVILCRRISTHAPAGGATMVRRSSSALWNYFYSRPCGRGDLEIW